jgi:hypothetical protein
MATTMAMEEWFRRKPTFPELVGVGKRFVLVLKEKKDFLGAFRPAIWLSRGD